MIDPAWAGVGAVIVTNMVGWGIMFHKNGTASSKWEGQIEERVKNVEDNEQACQKRMSEALTSIKEDISSVRLDMGKINSRITQSQGAV